MGKINLLDCTLRDGGYINDWRFGETATADIITSLENTRAEIIELGFIRNESYQSGRVIFNSMDQVKKLVGKKKPGVQYAVMSAVANPLPLDMLDPADEEAADIIRVLVWKTKRNTDGVEVDALEEAYRYCKGIVEKGYKLCVQPARVDQYSDKEFSDMVKRFVTLKPMAIYVVDSWGTRNPEEMLHYMHLADDLMPGDIALGYHGHNNMMQALCIAQFMLREKFKRDIILDASVYGIGRGAGNLNLELIAKYLNEYFGKQYDVDSMLKLYEKYIADIFTKEQWGYSIPFYLTACYNGNPNYARYLGHQLQLDADSIRFVLEHLSADDRILYRQSSADRLLEEYRAGRNSEM